MNSSNDQRNRRILVIDDNRGIHNSFREILRGAALDKSTLDEAEARLFGETPAGRRTLGFTMESAYQGEEGWPRNDHKALGTRLRSPGRHLHGALGLRLA